MVLYLTSKNTWVFLFKDFFFFFLMWTILKIFIEFVTILLLFYVLFFWACGILGPQPGIKPTPRHPALEDKTATTGPPGKACTGACLKCRFLG